VCAPCDARRGREYRARHRVPAPFPTSGNWKDIPGYEGLYQISDEGQVWRVGGTQGTRGGLIKTTRRDGKYWKVDLYLGGSGTEFRIHVLVAMAWLGDPPPDMRVVRHLNDNPDDNTVGNLAYGTQADNVQDMLRNGNGANQYGRYAS
jgi:NUMOD4 motif/HNH endonuclease